MSNEALKYILYVFVRIVHMCAWMCIYGCANAGDRYGSQKSTVSVVLQESSAIYFGLYLLVCLFV